MSGGPDREKPPSRDQTWVQLLQQGLGGSCSSGLGPLWLAKLPAHLHWKPSHLHSQVSLPEASGKGLTQVPLTKPLSQRSRGILRKRFPSRLCAGDLFTLALPFLPSPTLPWSLELKEPFVWGSLGSETIPPIPAGLPEPSQLCLSMAGGKWRREGQSALTLFWVLVMPAQQVIEGLTITSTLACCFNQPL